jgi:hypothetical protein
MGACSAHAGRLAALLFPRNAVPHSKAGCRCGAVLPELSAPLAVAENRHCGMCPNMSSSAFSTYGPLESATVRGAIRQELLAEYQVTPGARRHRCRVCGSPLFNEVRLRLGARGKHLCARLAGQASARRRSRGALDPAVPDVVRRA